MRHLWNFYKVLLSRHLLVTNTATSCAQIGVADVLQQCINGDMKVNGWDWRRTVRMSAVGLVVAPMLHGFYRVLDSRRFRGSYNIVVMKKLFWDTSFIPIFSCTFFVVAGLIEGNGYRRAFYEYHDKMWHIWKVDFAIWPPAQLLNFYFLPNSIRVIYVNVVSLIYNCMLSFIKHNDVHVIEKKI
ncbi:unnamed protein product [Auanema sp. JU1783]|nr:unnamed protein product [Auanema sp. JU1783]